MAIEHTASDVTTQGLQEDHKNRLLQGSNGLSNLDLRMAKHRVVWNYPVQEFQMLVSGLNKRHSGFTKLD
jgi:hypothetical protein